MKRSDEINSIGISLVASLPRPLRLTILRPGGRYLHRCCTGGGGPRNGELGQTPSSGPGLYSAHGVDREDMNMFIFAEIFQ